MKVIIFKSPNSKAIIGFSDNTEQFAAEWLKTRSQYINAKHDPGKDVTTFVMIDVVTDSEAPVYKIYGSELRSGETCWINCNDNLMGFNDNH